MQLIPLHTCLLSDKFNQKRIYDHCNISDGVLKPLTNLTKSFILDVTGVHDTPLMFRVTYFFIWIKKLLHLFLRTFIWHGNWSQYLFKFSFTIWCHPANIHLFKVNNRNTRKRWQICSKLIDTRTTVILKPAIQRCS